MNTLMFLGFRVLQSVPDFGEGFLTNLGTSITSFGDILKNTLAVVGSFFWDATLGTPTIIGWVLIFVIAASIVSAVLALVMRLISKIRIH